MALDTRDKLVALVVSGEHVPIVIPSRSNMAAAYICSLWGVASRGVRWPTGSIPSTAENPTDATTGAILLPAFSGSNKGYIVSFKPMGATVNTWMVYDRIGHMGGLSGTNTGSQTVSLAISTPVTDGRCRSDMADVEWYVEIYTDIGTTAANLTVTYTDTADTGSKTITITGFSGASPLNRAGRCVTLTPTDGIPIKSVQSVQLSGTTGTAGSFGITARVRKCVVGQMIANISPPGTDGISIGLPEIKSNVCLEVLVICSTTSTGVLYGELVWGQIA